MLQIKLFLKTIYEKLFRKVKKLQIKLFFKKLKIVTLNLNYFCYIYI